MQTSDEAVQAAADRGAIDWRNMSPEARRAQVEAWSSTRQLHAADWLDVRVLAGELFDSTLQALDADDLLRHYANRRPNAILNESEARQQTPNYDSGRGSPVSDPLGLLRRPNASVRLTLPR